MKSQGPELLTPLIKPHLLLSFGLFVMQWRIFSGLLNSHYESHWVSVQNNTL